jgi:Ricin-type beta-trefoil lectin domain
MTDRTDDVTRRSDPVLVRPYVTTGADSAAEPRAEDAETGPETWPETWPETATLPETPPPGDGDTAIQPVGPNAGSPAGPAKSSPMHWTRPLLALVIGVAVALGVAAYLIGGGDSRHDPRRGPSAALPVVNPPAATRAAHSPSRPSVPPSRTTSASSSPSPSTPTSAPPTTKQSAGSPSPAGPTLAAPPATDRTGRVASAGGRCLALGGLLGIDGSPIEVADCSGGTSQQFTLAADGTLQVVGRCATATGDATVRSDGCDAAGQGGQWRAGPYGSLVNPSTGKCLSDPGRNGATTEVEACTGGDEQRWFLP